MNKLTALCASIIFLFVFVCASPAIAETQAPTRVAALGEEFIIYQAGLAYLIHCGEFEIHRKMHPQYTKNAKLLAKTLSEEIAAQDPSFSPKLALDALAKQEDDLAASFATFYSKGDKCASSEALAAAEHVREFEDASTKSFKQYLASLKPRVLD